MDWRDSPEHGPPESELGGCAPGRGKGRTSSAGTPSPRIRKPGGGPPAARRRSPFGPPDARRRSGPGAPIPPLDPRPEPRLDDRARAGNRLRAPHGEPLPRVPRAGPGGEGLGGGGCPPSRAHDSPLCRAGRNRVRGPRHGADERAAFHRLRGAPRHGRDLSRLVHASARRSLLGRVRREPGRSSGLARPPSGRETLGGVEAVGPPHGFSSRARSRRRWPADGSPGGPGPKARDGHGGDRLAPRHGGVRPGAPQSRGHGAFEPRPHAAPGRRPARRCGRGIGGGVDGAAPPHEATAGGPEDRTGSRTADGSGNGRDCRPDPAAPEHDPPEPDEPGRTLRSPGDPSGDAPVAERGRRGRAVARFGAREARLPAERCRNSARELQEADAPRLVGLPGSALRVGGLPAPTTSSRTRSRADSAGSSFWWCSRRSLPSCSGSGTCSSP